MLPINIVTKACTIVSIFKKRVEFGVIRKNILQKKIFPIHRVKIIAEVSIGY